MQHRLGYGVMVTLQILVLPFLVRVRVPQLREDVSILTHPLCVLYNSLFGDKACQLDGIPHPVLGQQTLAIPIYGFGA